jgi:hypothetical protein
MQEETAALSLGHLFAGLNLTWSGLKVCQDNAGKS